VTRTGPLAELRGLRKSYGERLALEGFDLDVRPGEVLGLLGPNGAGKTTALRILVGQLAPDAGSVRIDGHDLAADPLGARARFAYVPDGAPLYANLSPREHLRLVGRLHGMEEDTLAAEATRLLDALELGERADDPIGGFSRGMRQKAALACALLPRAPLLVLDEPLSGLDAPTTAVIKECLRAWARGGGAVLTTSHQLDVVERLCDRMVVLDRGRTVAEGDLAALRTLAASDGTLEQVFGALTHMEDPAATARRILGTGGAGT